MYYSTWYINIVYICIIVHDVYIYVYNVLRIVLYYIMLYYICIIYGGVQSMEVPQIIQVIRIRPWLSIETTMATWGFTNFRTSFRPSWVTDGVTHGAYQCGIHLQSVKQCEGSVVNERRQDAAHGFLVAAQVVNCFAGCLARSLVPGSGQSCYQIPSFANRLAKFHPFLRKSFSVTDDGPDWPDSFWTVPRGWSTCFNQETNRDML